MGIDTDEDPCLAPLHTTQNRGRRFFRRSSRQLFEPRETLLSPRRRSGRSQPRMACDGGSNAARMDAAHSNIAVFEFVAQCFRKSAHGELAGRVSGLAG